MSKISHNRPYAAMIMNTNEHMFEVYIINPTDVNFTRIYKTTGGFNGWCGELKAKSHLLLEKSNLDELDDFIVWYHLDFEAEHSSNNLRVSLQLPKLSSIYMGKEGRARRISELDKVGRPIKLEDC